GIGFRQRTDVAGPFDLGIGRFAATDRQAPQSDTGRPDPQRLQELPAMLPAIPINVDRRMLMLREIPSPAREEVHGRRFQVVNAADRMCPGILVRKSTAWVDGFHARKRAANGRCEIKTLL